MAVAGSLTILISAALAPLVGTLLDVAVKQEDVVGSFLLRESTNLLSASAACLVLVLLTRIPHIRLHSLATLAVLASAAVLTFTLTRFVLQLSVNLLDLSGKAQWIGPEVLWALLLWPMLFTVLALVAQREQIVDAQLVLIDEARRALQDDQEALRSRVFDHLHGTVTSELVVARVRLNDLAEEIPDPETARQVFAVASNIQRLHELEVRRLAHVMVAAGLDSSLDEALRQLAESCEGLCEVAISIDPTYASIDAALDGDARATLRLTMYRIVEECLSNALRHAHADHVWVRIDAALEGRIGNISLIVTSDGEIPDVETAPGVGLRVIKARVAAYEGTVETQVTDAQFVVNARLRVPV